MCTIIEVLSEPIKSKIGYKIVIEHRGRYYGYISGWEIKVGQAKRYMDPNLVSDNSNASADQPLLSTLSTAYVLGWTPIHQGKYSFFVNENEARVEAQYAVRQNFNSYSYVLLQCETKTVTHTTKFSDSACFLAQEIVSIEKLPLYS